MAHKINFTANNSKEFKALVNKEHKSLSSCVRTIKENWSILRKIAAKDGLTCKDLNPAYMVQWLDGSNYCREGVLGRMVVTDKETKEKEFRAWETWTPGRALDYLRRASAAHCKSLGI